MKIVAFLQNMWLRNPASFQRMLDRCESDDHREKLRRRTVTYALFAGCVTGRRLKAAFGDLCDQIIWEEASPFVADNPRDYHPPNVEHIKSILAKHKPDVVLCFTKRGAPVIKSLCTCPVLSSSHPAARQSTVVDELKSVSDRLKLLMAQ